MEQPVELMVHGRVRHFLEGDEVRVEPAQLPVDEIGTSRITSRFQTFSVRTRRRMSTSRA
jgi:hypothetical protein